MKTTLNKLKAADACTERYKVLLTALGKTESDDEELPILKIIETNGIQDAIWSLRTVEGKDKELRLFAADCAEMALQIFENYYPNDDRPRKAIQAARDYANGIINAAARDAAGAAAWAAARDAAGAAAWAAARDAAGAAAWDAAGDAARAAAGTAARAAAGDAAWDAARDAAWAAAGATAWAAAWATAWATAGDAAWAAAGENIKNLLIKYL